MEKNVPLGSKKNQRQFMKPYLATQTQLIGENSGACTEATRAPTDRLKSDLLSKMSRQNPTAASLEKLSVLHAG